jgi:hypothetical protein
MPPRPGFEAGEVDAGPARSKPKGANRTLQRCELLLRIRLRIHLLMRLGNEAVFVDQICDPFRVLGLR